MNQLRSLALVMMAVVPSLASAKPTGIAGFSGKNTSTCNNCHSGGDEPTLVVEGPKQLTLGEAADFTVSLVGGAGAVAGVNVATTDGMAELTPGVGLKALNGELVHDGPAQFGANGSASFRFQVRPTQPGELTLFTAGLSADGTGSKSNDRGASANYTLSVVAAAVDAGMTEDPGKVPDASSPPAPHTDGGDGDAALEPGSQRPGDGLTEEERTAGCSTSGNLSSVLGLALLTALVRRRRRAR